MILVIVYVGAVAVLFLFVVMMLKLERVQTSEGFQKYAPVGAAVGVVLFGELAAVLFGWQVAPGADALRADPIPSDMFNAQAIGQVLYTNYVLLFQLAGLILLVAMIGAIVLTHRERTGTRRQNITVQQTRSVADTLEVLQVRLGAGVQELGIYRPKPKDAQDEEHETHEPAGGH
jgi:NADH-quinone oxidoreductase subunit J